MVGAFPYIVLVLVMSVLIKPFLQTYPGIGIKNLYSYGFSEISYRYIYICLAYSAYILFSVFKKIDIDIGATDAYFYMTYFNEIPRSFSLYMSEITTFEPGYSVITWLFKQITDEYKIMLFFWHSLTFFLTIIFLRHVNIRKHSFLSISGILLILVSQYNTLRMSISISIALIALIYLYEEKWLKALIIIFISVNIQISAVIMVPVWIIYLLVTKRKKYPVRQVIFYTIIGIAATAVMLRFVLIIMSNSAKSIYFDESSLAFGTYLAVFIIFVLSIIKYKEMIGLNSFNKMLIIMLPVCFLCILMQYRVAMMYRLTLYFIPVLMALIPSLCQCYLKRKNSAMGFAVAGILYAYLLYRLYTFFTEEIIYVGPYTNTLFIR